MSIDPYAYNITVRRAMFEGEVCFEARVKELPDLIEYADSPEEAYALAVDGIETTAKMLSEKERVMPVPTSPANDFSGRVTLRVAVRCTVLWRKLQMRKVSASTSTW